MATAPAKICLDGVGGGCHRAEDGVGDGVVVEAAGELADGACGLEPAEAGINRRRAAQCLEVLRSKYPTKTSLKASLASTNLEKSMATFGRKVALLKVLLLPKRERASAETAVSTTLPWGVASI